MSILPPVKTVVVDYTSGASQQPGAQTQYQPGSGPLQGTTNNFGFSLVNFDWITWHTFEHENWILADALLNVAIEFLNIRGIWQPLTEYDAGDTVIDPDNVSDFYIALSTHTSGTTFAADQPTYWELRTDNEATVTSVFGRIGAITAQESDYNAFYPTFAQVAATYLPTSTAAATYLSQSSAAATYLTQANAASTYLTQANAASIYLTQTDATNNYVQNTGAKRITGDTEFGGAIILDNLIPIWGRQPDLTPHEIVHVNASGNIEFGSIDWGRLEYITGASGYHDFYHGSTIGGVWTNSVLAMFGSDGIWMEGLLRANATVDPDTLAVTQEGVIIGHGGTNAYIDNARNVGNLQIRFGYTPIAYFGSQGYLYTSIDHEDGFAIGRGPNACHLNCVGGNHTINLQWAGTTKAYFTTDGALYTSIGGSLANPAIMIDYDGVPIHIYTDASNRLSISGPNGAKTAAFDDNGTTSSSGGTVITREKGDARYASISSRKYKDDVRAFTLAPKFIGGIIDAINPYNSWLWGGELGMKDPRRKEGRSFGIIIEDLAAIFPQGVRHREVVDPETGEDTDEIEPFAMNDTVMVSLLIAELQNLRARVKKIEGVIATQIGIP